MQLLNHYWYFTKALSVGLCNKILKLGKSKKVKQAVLQKDGTKEDQPLNKQEMETLKVKRNSKVVWLDELWIYKAIQPFVHTANRHAGWNFEWGWSESAQFTIYTKGMHYNWHIDSLPGPYTEEGPFQGKIRKLTSVLVLSDPKEYQGGELEFQFHAEDPQFNKQRQIRVAKEVAPKGSIIVFPSFVWHRVKPVTKGVRYTMPTWHIGYPFK
jgi:PKHD-type hydroxylase